MHLSLIFVFKEAYHLVRGGWLPWQQMGRKKGSVAGLEEQSSLQFQISGIKVHTTLKHLTKGLMVFCLDWLRRQEDRHTVASTPYPRQGCGWWWQPRFPLSSGSVTAHVLAPRAHTTHQLRTLLSDFGQQFRAKPPSEIHFLKFIIDWNHESSAWMSNFTPSPQTV